MNQTELELPKSCNHWIDPLLITIVLLAVYMGLRSSEVDNTQFAILISIAVTVLVCVLEYIRAPWRAIKREKQSFKKVLSSAFTKWLGNSGGFAIVLIYWWLLAEYQRDYFNPFFQTLHQALPFVPLVTGLCIFYTEWRVGPANEKSQHIGLVLLGRWKEADWRMIRDDLLGWFVKAFFLPINFCELVYALGRVRRSDSIVWDMEFTVAQPIILMMIYALIIASIIPGYLFSARLFNNHIRKVDFSWFGWVVTLCCYSPFVGAFFNRWFDYNPPIEGGQKPWQLFQDQPVLLFTLGGAIIFCELIHYWGEAIFGVRASNLTHRGVITGGPFRFCKHPIYLSKCVAWFLAWLPFMMGDGFFDSLRLTILFCGVAGIYIMRSWVEERLMAADPVYVQYGLWIDRHGLFAWVGKLIPFFSFSWRYKIWQEGGKLQKFDAT